MKSKYADWPRVFNQHDLALDHVTQSILGINRWDPIIIQEHLDCYTLSSGERRVVIHQRMNESVSYALESTNRAVVAGEPVRPKRYLGLLGKIRLLSSREKEETEKELSELFEKTGKKVDRIEFW